MKFSPVLLPVSLFVSAVAALAAPPTPTELVATPVPNMLGLHLNDYAYSWQPEYGAHCEVLVATTAARLEADVGDLWDSGRRAHQHSDISIRGKAFPDGANVWWKVRRWDGEEASPWSEPSQIQVPRYEPPVGAIRNRIVLLGGSMIAEMENYGHLETAITARWPHHDITFRNLGWPGDDVFGKARGEFGSAHNTRSWQPPGAEEGFGFQEMMKQVEEAKPNTLIVGYGAEAAFADSPTEMEEFKKGYQQLIERLEKTGAHLILLAPIKQHKHDAVLPDPAIENQRLEEVGGFILKLAKERKLQAHDLRSILFGGWFVNQKSNRDYDNGIRLNEHGQMTLARYLAQALGVKSVYIRGLEEDWRKAKRGYRWNWTLDHLPFLNESYSASTPLGNDDPYVIRIDGEVASVRGVERYNDIHYYENIRIGPDHEQVEQLRQKIIEKNQYHRFKIRPINKTYIYLFRRHEMGHLAYEMEDFDELIAGHEAAISHLRVPRPHSYEIDQLDPWKSPRDYPDHEVPREIPEPDVESELQSFTVADGFEVNLFAKDPMIANPINLNWDSRGRAWVSTSSTYPHIKPGRTPNDRIVILEDTDDDGVADQSTVFAEGLTVPHSVMPVRGGAYVCSTTEFLFLADHNGDDVADSRRAVFSGFGNADVHHMIHGLRWSPWGDLFFTQSIYINSFVDTAHGPRQLNGSGIWHFRPDNEQLDVFARGMVNPWGHAFDDWGQAFGTDGAGGAGPHYVFPGAAFRSATGTHRVLDGLIPGKPKNTAAEFVSGRHMPDHWQGSLLANDFRANRTVRYELVESGSGYTAKEIETVLHSTHRAYRPADIKMGTDGAVYVVDWYNSIIDHGEVDFHHPLRDKSHGRIWRLTAKDRPLVAKPKIHAAPITALLDLLKAPEQSTRIRANRELVRQRCNAENIDAWLDKLETSDERYEHHRLEALWLKKALNLPVDKLLSELLASGDHRVRAATVAQTAKLEALSAAVEDEHPQVRLAALSALRDVGGLDSVNIALRALDLPTDDNLSFALELTVRELKDQWLPALQEGQRLFDGAPERLAFALREVNDPRAVGALLERLKNSRIEDQHRANAVLTIASIGDEDQLETLVEFVSVTDRDLFPALAEGALLNPRRPREIPSGLSELLKDENRPRRIAGAQLTGHWKIGALDGALRILAQHAKALDEQSAAARALAKLGDLNDLEILAGERVTALAVWAEFAPSKAAAVAANWLSTTDSKQGVTMVLSGFFATQNGADLLAGQLDGKKVSESVAITGIRLAQSTGRNMTPLVDALSKAAQLVPVAQVLSAEQRAALLREAKTKGDVARGKNIFNRAAMLCSACHVVRGKGGKLGPDLSTVGSYMTPESLLESLLNPNTDIKQGYETVILTRRDGTVTAGLLQRKTEDATLIRDTAGTIVSVPAGDIASVDTSPVSLMPPGLTASLRHDELVDLMHYLTSLGNNSG